MKSINIIRVYKPTRFAVIVSTLQIVKISITVEVVPPISQRIYISNTILISYNSIIAPCVIAVFCNTSAIAVKYSYNISLQVCYIVIMIIVIIKTYRNAIIIIIEIYCISKPCLCRQLVAVPKVAEFYAIYCFACSQSVCVVGVELNMTKTQYTPTLFLIYQSNIKNMSTIPTLII